MLYLLACHRCVINSSIKCKSVLCCLLAPQDCLMHFIIIANLILRSLARLAAKQRRKALNNQSRRQNLCRPTPSSQATKHPQLSLLRAGTPNYSFDKHVSFVYPSLFDARGASAVPWYHPDTRGIFFRCPMVSHPIVPPLMYLDVTGSNLCRSISLISYHSILSSSLCWSIGPIPYHLFIS